MTRRVALSKNNLQLLSWGHSPEVETQLPNAMGCVLVCMSGVYVQCVLHRTHITFAPSQGNGKSRSGPDCLSGSLGWSSLRVANILQGVCKRLQRELSCPSSAKGPSESLHSQSVKTNRIEWIPFNPSCRSGRESSFCCTPKST